MLSCLHGLYDDRIYWKEALSLKKNGYKAIHVGVGDENKDFFSEEGIQLIQIARKHYFSNPYLDKVFRIITFSKSVYKQILRVAAKTDAEVYHFHDVQLNKIGLKLKKLPHKPIVIYDVHEPYPEAFRYGVNSGFIPKIIQYFFSFYIRRWELKRSENYDMVIATEENVARKFANFLNNKDKVKIIYNYTNLNPKIHLTPFKDKNYDAIYTGSIRSTRGVFQIIHAVRLARDKGFNLKVLLIGPVPEKGLKKMIKLLLEKYHLEENVIVKKPVVYTEIEKFYKQSKTGLIVFDDNPVNRTILPIKLFEYMAFGLPVICSNFGHMKAYTEKNETGLIVDPHSSVDICEKMIELISNGKLYEKLSKNGLQAVKEKYNWELMEKRLLEIYASF